MALQGSQGTPPDRTGVTLESLPLSTAYRSLTPGGQGNHPTPLPFLLALGLESTPERGGQSSCQVFLVLPWQRDVHSCTDTRLPYPTARGLSIPAAFTGILTLQKKISLLKLAQVSSRIDPESWYVSLASLGLSPDGSVSL